MISYKATRLLFCILCLCLAFGFLNKANAQSQPTLEKIFETWKKRQDNTRTFDYQWKEERTYTKGSMPVHKGAAQPPADVTHNSQISLQVDGDRMRLWSNVPPWNPQSGKFVPRDHMSVFDGKAEKVFYDRADPSVQATATDKVGYIGIHEYNEDVVDYHIWPILLTFRPLHRNMGKFKPNEWEMTGERGIAQGRNCLILRKKSRPIIERCWIDFERDCTIIRYEYITNYRFQVDTSFKNVPDQGWFPAGWTTVEYLPKGTLEQSSRSEVTGYTINKPLPEDWFVFEFPVGTEVNDYKTKEEFIVKEGGRKRLITEGERMRSATYEQLLATGSGQAGLPQQSRTSWWVFPALGCAGIVLLALLARKRLFKKA